MATIKPIRLGAMSPGLNNRRPPTELGHTMPDRSPATFLCAAENIDITARGYLRRRKGFTLKAAGSGAHSLWGDERDAYCVVGGDLLHLRSTEAGLEQSVAAEGLAPNLPVSYCRMPDGDVVWSNERRIGRLRGVFSLPLVTPRPMAIPTITVIEGGLPAGRYQLAFTQVGTVGESGATAPVAIDVPQGGGLQLSGLTEDEEAYMTGPNGTVFNRAIVTGETILTPSNVGGFLRTLNMADMPPGSVVRHYKGSLLVASGQMLYLSEPYLYGLFTPIKGYIPFPARITILEPLTSGVFVCADQTYWLAGGLQETQPAVVLPYGGLPGSGGSSRTVEGGQTTEQAFWMSPRGLVIGTPSGNASNVQEHALKFGAARSGATLFREQDGAHHIIAARLESAPPTAQAEGFEPVQTIVQGNDP